MEYEKMLTVAILILSLSVNAMAMEVPTDTIVQNLNGSQMCVKTFTVSADTAPQSLMEEPFDYEGYTYTFATMTKRENPVEDSKSHAETITVETAKKDLSTVLAALAPTLEYQNGGYQGTLNLDHTTIRTEAAGYARQSYTVSSTKEIANFASNDLSYVPATTVKDGVTLNLAGVDWQVQGTALVDDVLVPAQYKAVATYSAKASYSAATGYITTAEYTSTVSRTGVESVTYTLTYLGNEMVPEMEPRAPGLSSIQLYCIIGGGIGMVALVVLTILLICSRREVARLSQIAETHVVDTEYLEEEAETSIHTAGTQRPEATRFTAVPPAAQQECRRIKPLSALPVAGKLPHPPEVHDRHRPPEPHAQLPISARRRLVPQHREQPLHPPDQPRHGRKAGPRVAAVQLDKHPGPLAARQVRRRLPRRQSNLPVGGAPRLPPLWASPPVKPGGKRTTPGGQASPQQKNRPPQGMRGGKKDG